MVMITDRRWRYWCSILLSWFVIKASITFRSSIFWIRRSILVTRLLLSNKISTTWWSILVTRLLWSNKISTTWCTIFWIWRSLS
ncbi:hypothetical protein C0J52_07978 [Blattella germanica]|nr:hypothetical protein C0J52_07978 [Blattella germanica]